MNITTSDHAFVGELSSHQDSINNLLELKTFSEQLDQVNDSLALTLLPVIVIISVYMVIGLIGNPLVAVYYGCHVKPSPSYNFIVAMAVFDIMICCISIPLEIVDLRFPYEFPNKIACKILRFLNYFASIASGFVLIAIATDRYRKVCQPFKTQISTKMTKIVIIIIIVSSIFVSWPAIAFYDLYPVTNVSSIPGLVGYDCTFTREEDYKILIIIYNGICFIIFLGCIITLTVMYILIGRKLCKLKRFRFRAASKTSKESFGTPPTSSSEMDTKCNRINLEHMDRQMVSAISLIQKRNNETENVTTHLEVGPQKRMTAQDLEKGESKLPFQDLNGSNTKNQNTGRQMSEDSDTDTGLITSIFQTETSSKTRMIKRLQRRREHYIQLRKYTVLMLLISLAFIVSFLPYLGLITWRTLAPKYERKLLSKSELVTFNIFLRSWMISSVVNPLIYGVFNTDFRSYISSILKRCCRCCYRQ